MEPVRTCVGCRARAPRSSLLRVVAEESRLVVDEKAILPGRGAWVHPNVECVQNALRRHAFTRALRVSEPLDTQAIDQYRPRNKG